MSQTPNHRKQLYETESYKKHREEEGSPFDLQKMSRIVEFIRGALKKEADEVPKVKIKIKKLHKTIQNPNYIYFLKKTCQLSRKEVLRYVKTHQTRLIERSSQNAAQTLRRAEYQVQGEDGILRIVRTADDGEKKEVELTKLQTMNEIKPVMKNSLEFEYVLYKYEDDLTKISQASGLSREDTILGYYLNIHRVIEPGRALLALIAKREWPEGDRILFEENFKRHGRKFWKYQIPRTEKEIRVYALYYTQMPAPPGWSYEERGLFAQAYSRFKRDWDAYSALLLNRSVSELKSYYNEYFRRLSDEEQADEMRFSEERIWN